MSGTWTSQNKILPGAYINFLTNAPLSITPGDRGVVVLLQEMSVGAAGEMYTITATEDNYPEGITAADKLLVNEALKNAKKIVLYNLGSTSPHLISTIETALAALKTVQFNVLCYPYSAEEHNNEQETIMTWIKAMRDDEGVKIQYVTSNFGGDHEACINVMNGVVLSNGTILTAAQATAWVAGATAGAKVNQSNTGKAYEGAVDVAPRLTKSEMEAAITAGKFIFKVNSAQNVSAVYDINSLVTTTVDKGEVFRKNRVVRTVDGINNDIIEIFEANYVGKVNNNADGRSMLRATLIEYFGELQQLSAIQNFTEKDITVTAGTDSDAVLVECNIQPVDSVEKIYITVKLS
ncbi:MAG TPA: phage tail sheath protein [Clostridiales bacterium]|nr:phage tail sheath protein [Clostridiales bacterium]